MRYSELNKDIRDISVAASILNDNTLNPNDNGYNVYQDQGFFFIGTDCKYNITTLVEGDIVEVWSRRRLPTEYMYSPASSQYDVEVKARAVICFRYGKWFLDYDNNYNKALCKLRGNEQMERTVNASNKLYDFQYRGNEEWYREHNSHYKWSDIVKIGNTFENADLLEG